LSCCIVANNQQHWFVNGKLPSPTCPFLKWKYGSEYGEIKHSTITVSQEWKRIKKLIKSLLTVMQN